MTHTQWAVNKMNGKTHIVFSGQSATGDSWSHIILSSEEWDRFKKDVNKA